MTTNLIESIQRNLGFAELIKIDPNTQKVKSESVTDTRNFGQAAIPTVLLALYKYGNTDIGSEQILRGTKPASWLDIFFSDAKDDAVQKVAAYSGDPVTGVSGKMEQIATEAVRLIRENTPSGASFSDVKTFVAQQRSNILSYLPAQLQIGSLMNDNTLDDRTNKMEGPMSNGMHFFEKLFSGSTTEKIDKRDDE